MRKVRGEATDVVDQHADGDRVTALTDGRGRVVWTSAARPGRTHDITATRRDRVLSHLRATGSAP